ncbi:MAG: metallophosphoesterase [Phycisphaeraceae bacterium]|nr:metallophosphoesterase [Phycisphaeraceae bacterium]
MTDTTPSNVPPLSRREFLKTTGLSAAALAAGCASPLAQAAPAPDSKRITSGGASGGTSGGASGGFRIVHMTDVHLKPELEAAKGFAQCLAKIHELSPRPDFILAGGDMVESALPGDPEQAKRVFDLFTSVIKDCDIPIKYCIGNHDIYGWNSKGKLSPTDPLYGKKMFQERLGVAELTYGFAHKGWQFFVVDDLVQGKENPYLGTFDAKTLDFLDKGLTAAAGKPKAIFTHIPPFSLAVVYYRPPKGEELPIPGNLVCLNAFEVIRLLEKHKVELLGFGHLHQNEKIKYQYTTHVGSGAVCGNWWKGPNLGSKEGFSVFDFQSDGTFEHSYMDYGWVAKGS